MTGISTFRTYLIVPTVSIMLAVVLVLHSLTEFQYLSFLEIKGMIA